MKKLICAALVAGSMMAMAEEAAKCEGGKCTLPAAPAAEKAAVPTARPKMTPEQRQKMREQREKFMAERKAAMETKMLEVVKKYVPEEEKAKALIKDLQEAMMAGRRNMMRPPRPPKPAEAPAAK